jgi:formylglycine-generating enzyme required for sulfatase activity
MYGRCGHPGKTNSAADYSGSYLGAEVWPRYGQVWPAPVRTTPPGARVPPVESNPSSEYAPGWARSTMRGTMKLAILGLCVCAGAASWARGRQDQAEDAARAATDRGPAASASEIPALANLLAKAAWTPTPELSGVFKAGSIFEATAIGHRPLATNCFAAQPEESTYTAAEIVSSLQAGVSVGGPLASGGAYAGIVKKVKFGTPTQVSIPGMDLELSKACEDKLKKLPMSRIQSAYVVQEVLKAEISEQTCGKVDGRGSFVGLGSAEAEYAAACAQSSLEPVAVGYRTVPLADLLHLIAESGPVRSGGAAGWNSITGGGFDTSGTLARIQAAKDEEVRLNSELDACLDKEERKLVSQASADAASLAPLLKETSAKAKELGAADVKRYINLYGSAEVKCTNDLGERRRPVRIPAIDGMRAWLTAPPREDGVCGGSWTGPSGYAMTAVPAGTYEIGCTERQSGCNDDENPPHMVKISHCTLIGTTEVTQRVWQSVMAGNPSLNRSCGPNCPVDGVTLVDAAKFANLLSKADGLDTCYTINGESVSWPEGMSCTGYRLPTETEWEVAARGGRDSLYSGGEEAAAVGWTRENSDGATHAVRQKAANGYGLYDMSGNVWEWTWDWYGPYRSNIQVDPLGAEMGFFRVIRGGSCLLPAAHARVVGRAFGPPAGLSVPMGLRLARTSP